MTQWANAHLQLSAEDSAEPGQYRSDRAPYQAGVMDALSDPGVEQVVLMASAQVGKTLMLKAVLGFYIDQDPSPILVVQPTLEIGEAFSKDRLSPMVRDTPRLRGKIADPKARNSGNTILHKTFPGGHLTIAGANSPASLASRPIRVVLCDEVDRYPASAGAEGDPVNLARARAKTFWNRKVFLCSTPTDESTSRINRAWLASDMRRYWVPCPHCGAEQWLKWAQVQWPEGDPDAALYACECCAVLWTEGERTTAIRRGRWIAERPERKTAGFHLSELYSPWRRLSEIVAGFFDAKGAPETLKVWTNTSLGEVWKDDEGEGVTADDLPARREPYTVDSVPAGVLVVVAAIDVQNDRLEVEFKGFGVGEESWGLDYVVLAGDPGRDDVWDRLSEQLDRTFTRDDGAALGVYAAGLDTGGHHTKTAYEYARKKRGLVFALKGIGGAGKPLVKPGTTIKKSGVRLWIVGVDTAKELLLMSRIQISEPGPGYMHWPISNQFGTGYFEQLTAERAVTRFSHGQPYKVWTLPSGKRNEALDLNVYALAVLNIKKPNLKALALRAPKVRAQKKTEQTPEAPPTPAPQPTKPKRPKPGGWMSRYR
ncbi:MAG: phage terminase large subunit family protein [Methyloversatilis sp.]|nr:phage terminase large subunit family protein [Methyloversatilis sp.]